MTSAIELHDSKVEAITCVGKHITCHFSSAYVHRSEGRAGVDKGTVWTQAVQLSFQDATMTGNLPNPPETVWNGDFYLDGKSQSGLVPLPLPESSYAELDMQFDELHSASIRGKKPALQLIGEPRFVEEFKPANNPSSPSH